MTRKARKEAVLITGANGEIGTGLIQALSEWEGVQVVTLDLEPLGKEQRPLVHAWRAGNILDNQLIQRMVSEYEVSTIFHLAALLSTRAEFTPLMAHSVNVQGTLELLRLAHQQSTWSGKRTKFIFPSSIAVYGLPDLETKNTIRPLREYEYTGPTTMYGCNKLYCEHLGRYYSEHFQQLAANPSSGGLDFRAIRFPGLISAHTVPSGGTSDFAPEMIHAAAQGISYECFVRPDTTIPFMSMEDGVRALLQLATADETKLSQRTYNVTAYSPSAETFRDRVLEDFPEADITFNVHEKRQNIVDTWPREVDDSPARTDWGWKPTHDFSTTFDDYLLPAIHRRYSSST